MRPTCMGQRSRRAGHKCLRRIKTTAADRRRSIWREGHAPTRTFVFAARTHSARADADRTFAAQAAHEGRKESLRAAQGDRRTGLRTDQTSARDAPISVTWVGKSEGRMGADLPDAQRPEDAPAGDGPSSRRTARFGSISTLSSCFPQRPRLSLSVSKAMPRFIRYSSRFPRT